MSLYYSSFILKSNRVLGYDEVKTEDHYTQYYTLVPVEENEVNWALFGWF